MAALFSQLLDILLAVLLVVFVIVALRRFWWPAEKPRRKSLIREKDFDESEVLEVLDERFELREGEKQLRSDYLDGKLPVDDFRDRHRGVLLRLKEIDRRLKALGVLD